MRKNNLKFKRSRAVFWLALLLIFHIVNNYLYLKKDIALPDIDQSVHLTYSLTSYFLIMDFSISSLLKILHISSYYPPFFPITTTPLYFLLGISVDSAIYINLIYLILLILSTYGISKRIHSKKTSLFAAFLISFYPQIFLISRKYYLDLSLAAMTTLGIYLLILSNNFQNRRYSLLFGFVSGLGMLTKWTYLFFIIIPLFGSLQRGVVEKYKSKEDFPNSLLNFLLGFLLFFLVMSPWYLTNFYQLKENLSFGNILGITTGDPLPTEFKFYYYYIYHLFKTQIYPLFFLLFIAGFSILLFKKEKNDAENIVLSYLLGSFLILTFILNKDPRFSLPLLGGVAIISAYPMEIIKKFYKFILGSLIIMFALFQFYHLSLKYQPPPNQNFRLKEISSFILNYNLTQYPKEKLKEKRYWRLGIISESPYFQEHILRFYLLAETFPYIKSFPWKITSFSGNLNKDILKPIYYILIYQDKKREIPPELKNLFSDLNFVLIKKFNLSKESSAYLWRRKSI